MQEIRQQTSQEVLCDVVWFFCIQTFVTDLLVFVLVISRRMRRSQPSCNGVPFQLECTGVGGGRGGRGGWVGTGGQSGYTYGFRGFFLFLNRVFFFGKCHSRVWFWVKCLKQGIKNGTIFRLKHGQRLRGRAAPHHPRIYRVPSPPQGAQAPVSTKYQLAGINCLSRIRSKQANFSTHNPLPLANLRHHQLKLQKKYCQ